MDEHTLRQRLRQLGLSEKETDTYLAILCHGEAKASTIADEAGVSKRYVYSASEELADRGFVSVNDHLTPTTVRANPPREVIDRLTGELDELGPALAERHDRTSDHGRQFEVMKTQTTVRKRLQSILGEASEQVTVGAPASFLRHVEEELRAAVERGVFVVLCVTGEESTVREYDYEGLASVARTWPVPAPLLLTADWVRGVFVPHELAVRANVDLRGIAVGQEQLTEVFLGAFYGNYWPVSRPEYCEPPTRLPRSFDNVWHAAMHASRLVDEGRALSVRVSAVPIGPGRDRETFEGRVVRVRQPLVEPVDAEFGAQCHFAVDTGKTTVTVGGRGAFFEDFRAESIELRAAE